MCIDAKVTLAALPEDISSEDETDVAAQKIEECLFVLTEEQLFTEGVHKCLRENVAAWAWFHNDECVPPSGFGLGRWHHEQDVRTGLPAEVNVFAAHWALECRSWRSQWTRLLQKFEGMMATVPE